MNKALAQGAVIGILGGGQLGRMLAVRVLGAVARGVGAGASTEGIAGEQDGRAFDRKALAAGGKRDAGHDCADIF